MNKKIFRYMRKFFLLFVGLICLSAVSAQEQVADTTILNLSMADAQKYAAEHNRSIQNASLAVKQKEAARWQTIATMLPQVSGKLDYLNMCGYSISGFGPLGTMNPSGTASITASVALSGAQIVGALISNLTIDMADVTSKKTEQVINNNVITTYLTILTLQQTIELYEKNYENMQDLYKRAQKAVEVGSAEQISADQIEVQVNTYKTAIDTYKQNKEITLSMLRLYMGVGMDVNIKLTDAIEDVISPDECLQLLGTDFDINKNFDYQLAQHQTELAHKQVTLAAMDYLPSISAYYQYSAKTYFGESEGLNTTAPNTVGVSLAVPIWSSGKRAASITEKKLAYKSAQISQMDKEDQLQISNYQYRYNMQNEYDKFKVQEKNVEVCQKVLDNTSKKFEYGYASSTDVTTASQSLITAQTSYVSSLLSTIEAYLALRDLLNVEYSK